MDSIFLNSTQVMRQSLQGGVFYIENIDSLSLVNV